MTTTEAVSNRVREVAREQRISIATLSEKAGLADKTMRRRLVAPQKFTLEELCAISTALKMDLEDLVAA
ncbi:helix-turn-helix domain-containing protein [Leucobacter japonicus]|uniref:helix-turn-helix domain-containing protein n=1 Tax=Leucobacter japonicus TaxID=1461259 RepID=UPI00138F4B24|nr:helix-turn-helix domain-containing protein [Leucobacter japonicus]